ncbi:hypothetical protein RF55_10510 [Lasius niger]|uniref:Uncharacterized protein n=1 Tax=Lasius niger TaxID=67767 RepID=A0A0J7NB44_LASNI|nr:hypothetical protein RF55_10510 [Lasius niger]
MSARNDVSTVWCDLFAVAFQKSPIYLTDGVVTKWGNSALTSVGQFFDPNLPEGHPISNKFPFPLATLVADALGVAVSDTASGFNAIGGNFALGTDSLDDLMLDFEPVGKAGTLFESTPPSDPQVNAQAVDDNQLIHGSKMSLQMGVPPHTVGHYTALAALIPLMKAIFTQHQCLGGRYIIATPSYIWTGMMLTNFTDITEKPAQAPGSLFRLDFVKPVEKPQGNEMQVSEKYSSINKGNINYLPSPELMQV